MQLLIEEPIETALFAGSEAEMRDIHDKHGHAFWTVLLAIVRRFAPDQGPEAITTWSSSLSLLSEPELPAEADRIRHYIRMQLKTLSGVWEPLNQESIEGLLSHLSHLSHDQSAEMQSIVLGISEKTLRSAKQELGVENKVRLCERLVELDLKPLAVSDQGRWRVQMDAVDWLDTAIRATGEDGQIIFEPICTSKSIVEELVTRATFVSKLDGIALGKSDVQSFATLKRFRSNVDSSLILEALHSGMIENFVGGSSDSVAIGCTCLQRLHEFRLVEEHSAQILLSNDETGDSMLDALVLASGSDEDESMLLATLCWAHPILEIGKDVARIPKDRKVQLSQIRTDSDLQRSRLILNWLLEFECDAIVGTLAGKDCQALSLDLIELATADGNAAWVMPDWFPTSNAGWLVSGLNKRETAITEVVAQLEADGAAIQYFKANADVTVEKHRKAVRMFLNHSSAELKTEVADWAADRIRQVDRANWLSSLREDSDTLELAVEIYRIVEQPIVSSAFKNALMEIVPENLRGDFDFADVAETAACELANAMPTEIQRELGSQAFDRVLQCQRGLTNSVVALVGSSMIEPASQLSIDGKAELIARTVESADVATIDWCLQFVGRKNDDATTLSEEVATFLREELDAALQVDLESDRQDGLRALLKSFKLQPVEAELEIDATEDRGGE